MKRSVRKLVLFALVCVLCIGGDLVAQQATDWGFLTFVCLAALVVSDVVWDD